MGTKIFKIEEELSEKMKPKVAKPPPCQKIIVKYCSVTIIVSIGTPVLCCKKSNILPIF